MEVVSSAATDRLSHLQHRAAQDGSDTFTVSLPHEGFELRLLSAADFCNIQLGLQLGQYRVQDGL